MEEKINILDLDLDCITAKEALKRAIQFFDNDSPDTIEIVSMSTLMQYREDEEWKKMAGSMTLLLPGEAEILKAAEVSDKVKIKETEDGTFLKLFIKYLEKNRRNIYVLAQTEEELLKAEGLIKRYSRGIRISGHSIPGQEGAGEENIVNDINGTETDCILSVLPPPYQEEFIFRNRALINVSVWLGCGVMFARKFEKKRPVGRLKHFLQKKLFWYRVEQQNKEE